MGDLWLGRGKALIPGYIIHTWLFVSLQGVCFAHRYSCSATHELDICFVCSQHLSGKLLTPKFSLITD